MERPPVQSRTCLNFSLDYETISVDLLVAINSRKMLKSVAVAIQKNPRDVSQEQTASLINFSAYCSS
jgi:hypothetical protein